MRYIRDLLTDRLWSCGHWTFCEMLDDVCVCVCVCARAASVRWYCVQQVWQSFVWFSVECSFTGPASADCQVSDEPQPSTVASWQSVWFVYLWTLWSRPNEWTSLQKTDTQQQRLINDVDQSCSSASSQNLYGNLFLSRSAISMFISLLTYAQLWW